jgi:hypothetical protein
MYDERNEKAINWVMLLLRFAMTLVGSVIFAVSIAMYQGDNLDGAYTTATAVLGVLILTPVLERSLGRQWAALLRGGAQARSRWMPFGETLKLAAVIIAVALPLTALGMANGGAYQRGLLFAMWLAIAALIALRVVTAIRRLLARQDQA